MLTEEVSIQMQMELIDLQCLEDLKSKFLASHVQDSLTLYSTPKILNR